MNLMCISYEVIVIKKWKISEFPVLPINRVSNVRLGLGYNPRFNFTNVTIEIYI